MASVAERCWERAQQALESDGPQAAWAELQPLRGSILEDRAAGRAWLTLLRITAGRQGLVQDTTAIADAFVGDAEITLLACDALVRTAELLPIDVPPPEQGAAMSTVRLAQRGLERLSGADRSDPEVRGYLQINLANGLRLGHLHDRALAAYKAALATVPDRGAWWFNLGLLHKVRGSFEEGLEANRRAAELLGQERPVLWNTAICATALGKGAEAVAAFASLGIEATVAESGMPYVADLPPVQVRAAAVGPGHAGPSVVPDRSVSLELLWVSPLSPCHGVVQSASYRDAAIDYGDVILWDGAPADVGEHEGRPVPRFPLLSVLRKGDEHRFRFVALERSPGAVTALRDAIPKVAQLFVHSEDVVRGAHAVDDRAIEDTGALVYGKIVLPASADLTVFRRDFDSAVAAAPDVELVVPQLLEALGETADAGKAHTMWRGIERTVEKRSAT